MRVGFAALRAAGRRKRASVVICDGSDLTSPRAARAAKVNVDVAEKPSTPSCSAKVAKAGADVEESSTRTQKVVPVASENHASAMCYGVPSLAVKKRRMPHGGNQAPLESSTDFPIKIKVPGGVPIHLYTEDIDEATRRQLVNLAKSKMPVGFVSAMPDVHLGKGATIGSVFASKDYVCPNAVGVDIGCGMCAVPVEGPLYRKDLPERSLLAIQAGLRSSIPTGHESHGRSVRGAEETMRNLGAEYRPTTWIRQTLQSKHSRQLGTLGGGNHFVELVYDEEDRVWMMLHSGSRNIGNVTAQHYDGVAAKQCGGRKEALAYLKINSTEGQEYLTDMTYCQAYAAENRRFMMEALAHVVKRETGKSTLWSKMVNIHHNYCECEQCRYTDPATGEVREEKLWVTRKGATSARRDQLGIIPGSMGTGSYIVRGMGESQSWQSCSHGAGRSMSRKQALRELNEKAFVVHMKDRGIIWDSKFAGKVKDEAPWAYKDLNEVMRNQASLVKIEHHLLPLINMKGF